MFGLAIVIASVLAVDQPRIFTLNPGTSVWDIFVADLNGDKQGDILAVCCDETSDPLNKFLLLYPADESGTYSDKNCIKTPLDPSVSVLFTANLDETGPVEIFAANAEGVSAYAFQDGVLKQVHKSSFLSLYPSGSREPNFLKKAAMDLNGDKIDEWFVPMPTGFDVRNASGLVASVRCDVDSGIRTGSGISVSNKYPAYHPFPQDADATQQAIAFLSDEYADFAYGDNWTEHKRFKIPINLGDKWDTSADMEDIDGNGLPDLIVTQTQGTINLKALTQVYFAKGPMDYPSEPSAKFESQGSFAAPILKDVNGDEKLDLVFVNIPFGVKFFVNYFVWKKLGVDLVIHLYKEDGYELKPDFTTSVSIEAPEGKEQAAYALGDFNGDGNTDAAFGAGRNKLLLHGGGDVKFISSKPYLTLDVPSFGIAEAFKLNDNKSDDIVIYHPGISRKEWIEVLVF